MSSKLIVPVALGLSLSTVTALVVYHVFKKEEETDEDIDETDEDIDETKINVIKITVPKSIVPALIGRSGSNIKDIEANSGALIQFTKFSDKDYEVCTIRGCSLATQLAEVLVQDFISNPPVIVEDTMMVPGWACGRIIGTGGQNIYDISLRSGARVKIEGLAVRDNTQRAVLVKGTNEQIEQAKTLIRDCALEECHRDIERSMRISRHYQMQSSAFDHAVAILETPGASIEVFVCAVSSPSRFWVHIDGQEAERDKLSSKMTHYYSLSQNQEYHKLKEVSIGQMVAAVLGPNRSWYRARVHNVIPNVFNTTQQVAELFYVDYGEIDYVVTDELCELRADMHKPPFQAIECYLAGVRPAGTEAETVGVTSSGQQYDGWHPHAVKRFEELTEAEGWKPLTSRTSWYNRNASDKEIPGIELFYVTQDGNIDIGATLVAEGWAVSVPSASPRQISPPAAAPTPFGDLGNSRTKTYVNI